MHIQQLEGAKNCGVCVLSIVTGKPYDEVVQYVPACVNKHGLWLTHIQYALQYLTRHVWGIKHFDAPFYKQVSLYDFPKEMCIYGVYRAEANWVFHYIACDGEYLYDPLLPDRITLEQARLDYHSAWSIYAEIKR